MITESQLEQLRSAVRDAKFQAIQLRTTLGEIWRIIDDVDAAITKTPYAGPIEINQLFIWQKDNPRAWAFVTVTRIDFEDSKGVRFDERRIWTRVIRSANYHLAAETWNEESHFRESVTPCDEHGAPKE